MRGNRQPDGAEVRPFRSIFLRLTAFALLLSILPVLLISSLLLRRMEEMTERELEQSYRWLVSEHLGHAEEKLAQYAASLRATARNTTILDTLEGEGADPYIRGKVISNEVFKAVGMENHQEIHNCVVYSTGGSLVYGSCAAMFTDAERRLWQNQGWDDRREWFLSQSLNGRWMLSLAYPLRRVDVQSFTAARLGLIRLDIYLDRLFAPAGDDVEDYQVVLLDSGGRQLYASRSGLDPLVDAWRTADTADDRMENVGSYTVLTRELTDYGLSLLYLFDKDELIAQKLALKQMLYPMLLCVAAAIVLGAYWYFRSFSARVGKLVDKFRIAATGDLSPTPPIGGGDEIAMLDWQFGRMLGEMDELNRRSFAQQAEIREAEYRNLQLQINPHFLYNTLETISAIGAMHQAFQVCDLCEKLGDIFRYSLGKNEGKYTAVANELRQTQNYIFIQQVRYRFEVFYSIEVDADEVYMLRFLLQPIVENAVLHGLAKKEDAGTLEVYVGRRGDDLEIRISDDGAGMTPEQLERLRAQIREQTDPRENVSNIGVWNISQRIRLSYGERYGVEVASRPGQGSAFVLRLPFITKGMVENDEV